jgi:hypothetical protein
MGIRSQERRMDATARRAVHMQMVACCVDWKRESGVGDDTIGRKLDVQATLGKGSTDANSLLFF